VGRGTLQFGDRRRSDALKRPAEALDAGVVSCGFIALEWRMSGAGDGLRSAVGDFGGTRGGSSGSSAMLPVSTLSKGLGVAPGLRMGESGLPVPLLSDERGPLFECEEAAEGPVTQTIMASPKGPVLQFEPGALHDRSWPKAS